MAKFLVRQDSQPISLLEIVRALNDISLALQIASKLQVDASNKQDAIQSFRAK